MTLTEQLAAVHQYAEYLEGLGGHAFPQRDKRGVALRTAARAVLEAVQGWPALGTTARGLLLQAPTGQQVLYRTNRISERLELIEAPPDLLAEQSA
jgi:hypothetical protein